MRKLLLLQCLFISSFAVAQQARPAASGKIYGDMHKLNNLVNVLYVAAHPDDENTRLLAWLVNEKNIRTAYLSLTRGDGGQNILGSELGEALGLIRTHELMEARRLDGAEQFFTRAIDFGFSKTHEETFKHWPQKELTGDAVWVYRKFRPDVVICRFPPNTMAGHGQHAASAIIAANAFKDAGDRTKYPEQLKYFTQWQPKRLLLNTYKFGDRNTTAEDQFKLAVGQYIPSLGMGVGELAGQSRSIHKSQGAGTPSVPGMQIEYFKLVDGDTLTTSLFDGIDITWNRVGRPDIGTDIQKVIDKYDFMHPDASLPALLAVRKKIAAVSDDYWRKQKLAEIDQLILDCTGLMIELYTKQPQTAAGATLPFTLRMIARSHTPVKVTGIRWGYADTVMDQRLSFDTLLTFEHMLNLPAKEPATEPYWLASAPFSPAMYSIANDTVQGLPETPCNLFGVLHLDVAGTPFDINVPLSYKKLDPVKGDVVEQLRIVPAATVAFNSDILVVKQGSPVQVDVRVHAYSELRNGSLSITEGNGTKSIVEVASINLNQGADTIITVSVTPSKDATQLKATVTTKDGKMAEAQHLIQYTHLPTLQYFKPAAAGIVQNTWQCTAKKIGYIEGAGDYIPALLRLSGLEVDVLKESDLTSAAKLKKYDAIITGIRAVNVEKRMAYWLPVLFEYANNGGTLVMQYNTTQDMSTTKLGPYPFTIASDKRVTEEDAKITFIDPAHRLLTYPNKITDADFDNWVQERGLYFASKWDDHYTTLFSMNDAGEQPLNGGTLYTKYGTGHYIYTSLSFNRQLPAGNKGAIRLLMNMLSIGK